MPALFCSIVLGSIEQNRSLRAVFCKAEATPTAVEHPTEQTRWRSLSPGESTKFKPDRRRRCSEDL